ncbi:MAG: GNAT family N-acetyltransferase [Candidatus Hermodarchaeota archaeon]
MIIEFVVGYDYKKNGYSMDEFREEFISEYGYSDEIDEETVNDNPSHLIAMIEDDQVIGWAIWHECSTSEHRVGFPRDEEDMKILERLSNGPCEAIELHELWLKKAYRGKGYGKQFFDFFEDFVLTNGDNRIFYYSDNASAISLCRKRGYKESYGEGFRWHTFFKEIHK